MVDEVQDTRVNVGISEYDIDLFRELVQDGKPFTWSFDGVEITFFSVEHKRDELLNEIAGLKQSMEHAGAGSKDIRLLHSLESELEDLE
jgi:hypothetical protein